ncbi:MAG: zinc-dependent peptidase [Nitrosomonadales bacterium]|nr:zinc-dependent peptidase [Nitrosomonadales bacterium]
MRRIVQRHPLPHHIWHQATRQLVVLQGLDAVQMAHLRELTTWFLHSKAINGVHGLEVTMPMRVAVAAQACLLILNLGTRYFDNWVEVVLYPGAFGVSREQTDEIGLVHEDTQVLSGESWIRGPVVLSWDDVEWDSYHQTGSNVVLHEFAHKLDGLSGETNGMPPLHRGMSRKIWAESMSSAYDALHRQAAAGKPPCIDPYAATNPAEFFAVVTEYFFTEPETLKDCYPEVHRQLALFYQQPVSR